MEGSHVLPLVLLLFVTVGVDYSEASDAADELFKEYFSWKVSKCNPEYGILLGRNHLWKGTELNNYSWTFQTELRRGCEKFKERAERLLRNKQLDKHQKIYLEMMVLETDYCVNSFDCNANLLAPIDFLHGVQIGLPKLFSEDDTMPFDTIDHYRTAKLLLGEIPKQLSEIKELLKEGVRRKVTHAEQSLGRARSQFERLQVAPEESVFYKKFGEMKRRLPSADLYELDSIQQDAKRKIEIEVLPAFKDLQEYVYGTYYNHLRATPAMHSLPDGDKCYLHRVTFYTTLNGFTLERIHNEGLDEVKRLRTEARDSFGGKSLRDVVKALDQQSNATFDSENKTINFFRQQMKIIGRALKRVFSDNALSEDVYALDAKPLAPGEVELAYYAVGSSERRRNGTVFVNTANPKLLKTYQTLSLALTQGNPGYHLQSITAAIDPKVPDFVKHPVSVVQPLDSTDGYREGWALYASYLGNEMGVFGQDPQQLVGYYSLNLLQAAKLVIDTGIHAFRWSREEAVDFLYQNTGLCRDLCELEVDSCITDPGRALAPKLGEQEIKRLRSAREKAGGRNFLVKQFHDGILSCNGPLPMLRSCYELRAKEKRKKSGASSVTSVRGVVMTVIYLLLDRTRRLMLN